MCAPTNIAVKEAGPADWPKTKSVIIQKILISEALGFPNLAQAGQDLYIKSIEASWFFAPKTPVKTPVSGEVD